MNRTVSQAAKILGTNIQQVKKWAWLFKDYLSGAANPDKGHSRAFTDTDILALIHVALHWEEEPDMEAIQNGLDGNYEEYRHFLYQNTPILQEPPEDLDETWGHGVLLNGVIAREGYLELARNYKRSADSLLDSALNSGEARDWSAPVLFAYRHALELYLKIIGRNENQIHSLKECVEQIEKYHKLKISSPIREWILELDAIDPRGTIFRYADDAANSKLNFAEFWVDFAQLKYAMQIIFKTLDQSVWALEEKNDLPEPSWFWREHRNKRVRMHY